MIRALLYIKYIYNIIVFVSYAIVMYTNSQDCDSSFFKTAVVNFDRHGIGAADPGQAS